MEIASCCLRAGRPRAGSTHTRDQGDSVKLRCLTFSNSEAYTDSFTPLPSGKTNRMVDRYGAKKFLVVHFNFKMKPKDIIVILSKGVFLDGENYQFIGCSSSGLKKRSCYLMRGTVDEVVRVRDVECGQFANVTSIPKKLKGIGLLFSNAIPTGIEVRNDDVTITEDKLSADSRYNFTDGCGAIGSEMHKLVIESAKLNDMLPEGYIPSVLQIRLKGYKGVVALDPALEKHGILVRKSMIKFESGTRPFSRVWLCNYSKPYSIGYLNQQYIMLLSGLGVPDEILLKKQHDYYEQMRSLKQNPEVSFEQLCIGGQHVLATLVATGHHSDRRVQEELSQIQRKFLMKMSKLRIQIQDSRTAFGICDTSEELDYGECFFRPTINGHPHTISGEVIVAKNPSYFLGDVRVLTAVAGSRVKHLCHLIDCLVFPTRGQRPHPDEITGSDLDGDEYFVCWDEELSIEKLRNPVDFLAIAKASMSKSSRWSSCIEYVAGQVNLMGLLNSHYLYWAETKGVQSTECQELGQLFSHSVDASKTGDRLVVPKHLIPPREGRAVESTAVWKRMSLVATEFSEQFTESVVRSADSVVSFSEEFIARIVQSKIRKIPEFSLLTMLKKWCYGQALTDAECMKKLVEFSKHINFGKLTLQQKLSALELGIPVEMVTNALTATQLLMVEMMQQFSLTDPHNRWCFYIHATSAEFNWDDLLTAVTTYPESLVICKLSSGVIFALHFLTKMKTGEYLLEAGSIIGYFFSSKFKLLLRHVLGSTFSIDLNTDSLQLYRQGVKQNTFVWIKSKVLNPAALAETEFDRISIDLPTFQKDILRKYKHPTVNKEQVTALEVYVASGTEQPTYYDRLLSYLQCDNLDSPEDDKEDVEEIPREPEKEGRSTVPHAGASLIECLRVCACDGRLDEFSVILQSILTSDERERSVLQLGDAVHVLLSVFVKKFAHIRQPEHLDKLVPVLASLQFAICSAKSCLLLLHRVSLLHSLELSSRVGDIVLSCIELTSTSEYLEVLLHWEWWYFLPEPLANSLAGMLYTLSQSLLPDKPPAPRAHIETLCRARDAQELPTELKGMLEEYVHYYSYLYHCSFLDEAHSLRSRDTDSSTASITMLKVCDPANPHPELHTEEEEHSGEEGNSKPTPQRMLEFHRSKGVSSRLNGYVIISFMLRDSAVGSVPVAYGLITEASRQPTNIVVKVPEPIPLCIESSIKFGRGHWQLHSVGNVTSFVRGMKAISLLAKTGLMATSLASILVHPEGALYGDISTATCVRNPPKPAIESCEPEPASLNSLYNSREDVNLNSKQTEAMISSLDHSLTLIHGPPGTGKTRIACEIVYRYLARKTEFGAEAIDVQAKVLVAAETNMAVDNLARQLMHQQVHVIRIGNKEQTSDDVYSQISLESLVARSSESKKSYIDRKIALKILRDADVVATTCAGAGDGILKSFKFPFIIIDEATQVKEPVSLVAITKKCQQLTLIGDPEQLAPFNLSSQSHERDYSSTPGVEELAVTLFHRLQSVVPSVVLEEQYRMSSKLVKFPSSKFYGGKLVCSPSIEGRLPNFELRSDSPIDFIDVVSSKESHVGTSFKNDPEANVVVDVVKYLLDNNVSPLEMTILTPYKKQVQCLIEKLSRSVSKVEVTTIDNFQGKENDVIIFSMVRSNVLGDLHFIAKRNRINVLLTRAKHCVIGVGSRRKSIYRRTGCKKLTYCLVIASIREG